MNNFFIGFVLLLVLCIPGCTETPGEDLALSERAPAERSAKAGELATPNVQHAAPNTTTSATDEGSGVSGTSTSEENSAERDVSFEASPISDVQKNFDAGIAAFQANNLPLAFQEFQTAAKNGHADSQFNLGLMYEQGIGTAKNESQAVAWYRESAIQGNSAAQFNLGVLYENGRGTKVDFAEANKWYRSASVQGDALAIGNLGMLYIRGDGVAENKVAGVALLMMSATMDRSPENLARRNISSTRGLTGEMIASAQTLSAELSTAENMLVSLDQFLEQFGSKQ
jgi:TPR repeat protein